MKIMQLSILWIGLVYAGRQPSTCNEAPAGAFDFGCSDSMVQCVGPDGRDYCQPCLPMGDKFCENHDCAEESELQAAGEVFMSLTRSECEQRCASAAAFYFEDEAGVCACWYEAQPAARLVAPAFLQRGTVQRDRKCELCLLPELVCECPQPPTQCDAGMDLCFEPPAPEACEESPLECKGHEYCAPAGGCLPVQPECEEGETMCGWHVCPGEYGDGPASPPEFWCQTGATCPTQVCCAAAETICFEPPAPDCEDCVGREFCAAECPKVDYWAGYDESQNVTAADDSKSGHVEIEYPENSAMPPPQQTCADWEMQECHWQGCETDEWFSAEQGTQTWCDYECPPQPSCCQDHGQKTCFQPSTGNSTWMSEFCVNEDVACPQLDAGCREGQHVCDFYSCDDTEGSFASTVCMDEVPGLNSPCGPAPVCCPENMQTCWDPPSADCDWSDGAGCWGLEYCAEECAPQVPLDHPSCGDFDTDGDGFISEAEAKVGCQASGVPEAQCYETFHMFDLNEDLQVDCEYEFSYAEDVMKFQALDLNQDGNLDMSESLFFCQAHGIDPSQCEDMFSFCDAPPAGNGDELLSLPEMTQCTPPAEYAKVEANYDEQKYDSTLGSDPETEMEAYTEDAKKPANATLFLARTSVERDAPLALAHADHVNPAYKDASLHGVAAKTLGGGTKAAGRGRKKCMAPAPEHEQFTPSAKGLSSVDAVLIRPRLWKGRLPRALAHWAKSQLQWAKRDAGNVTAPSQPHVTAPSKPHVTKQSTAPMQGEGKAQRSNSTGHRKQKLGKTAVRALEILRAKPLHGRRPNFAAALQGGRGAVEFFKADLRRLRATLKPHLRHAKVAAVVDTGLASVYTVKPRSDAVVRKATS